MKNLLVVIAICNTILQANAQELLKDINTTTDLTKSLSPQWLTDVNGTVFFSGQDEKGRSLWKSDGTADGTRKLLGTAPGNTVFFEPELLTSSGGILYFTARDNQFGHELW